MSNLKGAYLLPSDGLPLTVLVNPDLPADEAARVRSEIAWATRKAWLLPFAWCLVAVASAMSSVYVMVSVGLVNGSTAVPLGFAWYFALMFLFMWSGAGVPSLPREWDDLLTRRRWVRTTRRTWDAIHSHQCLDDAERYAQVWQAGWELAVANHALIHTNDALLPAAVARYEYAKTHFDDVMNAPTSQEDQ